MKVKIEKTLASKHVGVDVQIGDDETDDIFYRILGYKAGGSSYGYLLERHVKSSVFNPRAGEHQTKFRVEKTYHCDLFHIVRAILQTEQYENRNIVTLHQLLEAEKQLNDRMMELMENIYYIMEHADEQ